MGSHPKLLCRGETNSCASFWNVNGGSVEEGRGKMTSFAWGRGPCKEHTDWNFPMHSCKRQPRGMAGALVAVFAKGRLVKQAVSFILRIF